MLNFVVAVANIYFTDVFLGGRFLKYGTQVSRDKKEWKIEAVTIKLYLGDQVLQSLARGEKRHAEPDVHRFPHCDEASNGLLFAKATNRDLLSNRLSGNEEKAQLIRLVSEAKLAN